MAPAAGLAHASAAPSTATATTTRRLFAPTIRCPPGLDRLSLLGLTQLEALDLPRRRAREVLDELHHVRVLVAAQVVLAPAAQLAGQRVGIGRRLGAVDERL